MRNEALKWLYIAPIQIFHFSFHKINVTFEIYGTKFLIITVQLHNIFNSWKILNMNYACNLINFFTLNNSFVVFAYLLQVRPLCHALRNVTRLHTFVGREFAGHVSWILRQFAEETSGEGASLRRDQQRQQFRARCRFAKFVFEFG